MNASVEQSAQKNRRIDFGIAVGISSILAIGAAIKYGSRPDTSLPKPDTKGMLACDATRSEIQVDLGRSIAAFTKVEQVFAGRLLRTPEDYAVLACYENVTTAHEYFLTAEGAVQFAKPFPGVNDPGIPLPTGLSRHFNS